MSVYDREANGRGRYEENVFVGGSKISKGPMFFWRMNAQRQWEMDGCPDRDQDPSNPYHALDTYETLVCARTVAELERLIESARWAGWVDGYYANGRPSRFSAYRVMWHNKRQGRAVDTARRRLESVLRHVRAAMEETGYTPYGVDHTGHIVGYRMHSDLSKADESLVALMSMDLGD